MLKIRRPLGRLIFNMGIAIPVKTVFLIETAPRSGRVIQSWVHVPPERSVVTIRPYITVKMPLKPGAHWLTLIVLYAWLPIHSPTSTTVWLNHRWVYGWVITQLYMDVISYSYMPCKAKVYIYIYIYICIYHRYWKNVSDNRYSERLNNYSYYACVEMHVTL